MPSALVRGALAGALGTLAMDAVWFARYRRGGGKSAFAEWEFGAPAESWDEAPAPARMGRLLARKLLGAELGPERIRLVNNVMHWGYGLVWATQYDLLRSRVRSRLWHGPAFGATVWASDYVVLPLAGIYEPIWKYDPGTLWQDLSAHLVFGTATDAALRVL